MGLKEVFKRKPTREEQYYTALIDVLYALRDAESITTAYIENISDEWWPNVKEFLSDNGIIHFASGVVWSINRNAMQLHCNRLEIELDKIQRENDYAKVSDKSTKLTIIFTIISIIGAVASCVASVFCWYWAK